MTLLSTLLSQMTPLENGWSVNPSEDWRQGRTLFGGLSAGLCFAACERLMPELPPLRSAQIAYVGPAMGEAILRPSILRQGKSVTFMACDLSTDGAVSTRASFVFGGARDSDHTQDAPRAPDVSRPDECPELFGERRPTFTQHLDQRFAGGHRPITGAPTGEMLVWVKLRDVAAPSPIAALVLLGDALPPASMPRLIAPAAISTMNWHFDVVDAARFDPQAYVLIRCSDEALGHGYSSQTMAMWNEAGEPILIGRQSVAIFA